jgi:hypothetical protein
MFGVFDADFEIEGESFFSGFECLEFEFFDEIV